MPHPWKSPPINPGGAKIAFGIILDMLGVFCALAATPFNGAGSVATVLLWLGNGLLFWGVMQSYFARIDRRLFELYGGLSGQADQSQGPSSPSAESPPDD